MKFLFHAEVPHAISCTVLNKGGDILKHVHTGPELVGVHGKHAHIVNIGHFVETFQLVLEVVSWQRHDVLPCGS